MARHLMAVCVVCLLCAEHLPCKQHFEETVKTAVNLIEMKENFPIPIYNYDVGSRNGRSYSEQYVRSSLSFVSPESSAPSSSLSSNFMVDDSNFDSNNNYENRQINNLATKPRKGRTKFFINTKNEENLQTKNRQLIKNINNNKISNRIKRHAGHYHDHDDESDNKHEENGRQEQSQLFVNKLFQQFGDEKTSTMNVIGFEKMLKHLGLYRLLEEQINDNNKSNNNNQNNNNNNNIQNDHKLFADKNDSCISSVEFVKRIINHQSIANRTTINHKNDHEHSHNHENHLPTATNLLSNGDVYTTTTAALTKSLSSGGINNDSTINSTKTSTNLLKQTLQIKPDDLIVMCPILLYHITAETSRERSGCISSDSIPLSFYKTNHHNDHHNHDQNNQGAKDRTLVWVYATVSILVASLCGLLAVAVIPCMEHHYYQYFLQFFVALGVGTLAGDALLHLVPHAMMIQSKNDDPHVTMTLKGLVAAAGLVFFFLTERVLTMIAEWRKRIQKKEKPSSRVRVMREVDPQSAVIVGNSSGCNVSGIGGTCNAIGDGSGVGGGGGGIGGGGGSSSGGNIGITGNNPHTNTAEKQCKAKYSSYPYCYDEIDMDTKDNHHHHKREMPPPSTTGSSTKTPISLKNFTTSTVDDSHNHNHIGHENKYKTLINNERYSNHHDYLDAEEKLLSTGMNNYTISDSYMIALRDSKDCVDGGGCGGGEITVATTDTNTVSTNLDNGSVESGQNNKLVLSHSHPHHPHHPHHHHSHPHQHHNQDIGVTAPLAPEENYTIILREHESKHHGHSHTHGHVHSPPSSLSAVAWMVIMGDGLHNFTDGMAIGAAFSNNIAGGFSTALAVFCHELPHELGDFAILLKAGMSARQAVYYNVLSSVLSFIGTIIGIWIGDTPEASAWIFACAAGMFLYIALVDMMPELTSSHKESYALTQLILQLVGISIGIGIMLLIALYEHDLRVLFSSE